MKKAPIKRCFSFIYNLNTRWLFTLFKHRTSVLLIKQMFSQKQRRWLLSKDSLLVSVWLFQYLHLVLMWNRFRLNLYQIFLLSRMLNLLWKFHWFCWFFLVLSQLSRFAVLLCLMYYSFRFFKNWLQSSKQKQQIFKQWFVKSCWFSFFLLPFWTTYDINEINIQNHFRMSIHWHFKKNIYIKAVDISLWNTQEIFYMLMFFCYERIQWCITTATWLWRKRQKSQFIYQSLLYYKKLLKISCFYQATIQAWRNRTIWNHSISCILQNAQELQMNNTEQMCRIQCDLCNQMFFQVLQYDMNENEIQSRTDSDVQTRASETWANERRRLSTNAHCNQIVFKIRRNQIAWWTDDWNTTRNLIEKIRNRQM